MMAARLSSDAGELGGGVIGGRGPEGGANGAMEATTTAWSEVDSMAKPSVLTAAGVLEKTGSSVVTSNAASELFAALMTAEMIADPGMTVQLTLDASTPAAVAILDAIWTGS